MTTTLIPTIPSTAPILPTPFPQALDSGLSQNFSSSSCSSFFANMTSDASFRTCRPFSLLLGSSAAFINAQSNLTLLNSILWGTCNSPTPYDQCISNMNSFASSLQSNCPKELKQDNIIVSNTLIELQSFQLLYSSSCLSSPSSNTYCYLTASYNPNPFDLYVYSLPLGIPIPNSSTPTCSDCSNSVMTVYANALKNGQAGQGQSGGLGLLKDTFTNALQICQSGCGQQFNLIAQGLNLSTASLPTFNLPTLLLALLLSLAPSFLTFG